MASINAYAYFGNIFEAEVTLQLGSGMHRVPDSALGEIALAELSNYGNVPGQWRFSRVERHYDEDAGEHRATVHFKR